MKKYYPVMIELEGKACLVVGAGRVAERKIDALLESGASITVISPTATGRIEELAKMNAIRYLQREYQSGDLKENFLIILATDRPEVNRSIYVDIDHSRQFVNIVDAPELCTFIVPAVVDRGRLQIAISTNGASPGLAKKIRQDLEIKYSEVYEEYTNFLADMRKLIIATIDNKKQREKFFSRLLEKEILTEIEAGNRKGIEELLKAAIYAEKTK